MFELCTAGKLETIAVIRSFKTQLKRRLRFSDLGDLSEVVQPPIRSCNRGTAIRANKNERRARFEFDRTGARWAVCSENGYMSPPAI